MKTQNKADKATANCNIARTRFVLLQNERRLRQKRQPYNKNDEQQKNTDEEQHGKNDWNGRNSE